MLHCSVHKQSLHISLSSVSPPPPNSPSVSTAQTCLRLFYQHPQSSHHTWKAFRLCGSELPRWLFGRFAGRLSLNWTLEYPAVILLNFPIWDCSFCSVSSLSICEDGMEVTCSGVILVPRVLQQRRPLALPTLACPLLVPRCVFSGQLNWSQMSTEWTEHTSSRTHWNWVFLFFFWHWSSAASGEPQFNLNTLSAPDGYVVRPRESSVHLTPEPLPGSQHCPLWSSGFSAK